jgi:hypothetical protein
VRVYIPTYAYGHDPYDPHYPDREGIERLVKALEVGKRYDDSMIVLAANLPKRGTTLSSAAKRFLADWDWPRSRILVHPKGYNMLTETIYMWSAIRGHFFAQPLDYFSIVPVTSWGHHWRVKLAWRMVAQKIVRVETSKPVLYTNPISREILAIAWMPMQFLKIKGLVSEEESALFGKFVQS